MNKCLLAWKEVLGRAHVILVYMLPIVTFPEIAKPAKTPIISKQHSLAISVFSPDSLIAEENALLDLGGIGGDCVIVDEVVRVGRNSEPRHLHFGVAQASVRDSRVAQSEKYHKLPRYIKGNGSASNSSRVSPTFADRDRKYTRTTAPYP